MNDTHWELLAMISSVAIFWLATYACLKDKDE